MTHTVVQDPVDTHPPSQELVNDYFRSQSFVWEEIYARGGAPGVWAEVYRKRHAAVLAWVDDLGYTPGSRVLEIGCGAGFLAATLAGKGLRVHAIDSSAAMVERARRHGRDAGVADHLTVDVGDVHSLAFADNAFDLVLALGVLPWLDEIEQALHEMVRVTRPGGHVIVTAANRAGLVYVLDPTLNPILRPLARRVTSALVWAGLRQRSPNMAWHSRRSIDAALGRAGLIKIRDATSGFGPFTFLGRQVLPEPFATRLHRRLQQLADRGMPIVRSSGKTYRVLARKPIHSSIERTVDAE